MRLYFLRHAHAGAAMGGADAGRTLTAEGKDAARDTAAALRRLGVAPERLLTSPYVRAAETAAIVADELGSAVPPVTDDRLASGFGMRGLRGILAEHASAESVLLVGHEPDFSDVIGELVGGARVRMKKAGVARVDVADPSQPEGVLVWLAPPALLRI